MEIEIDEDADGGEGGESLGNYPTLNRLQDMLAEDHSDREFDDGLDDLIERIRTTKDS